MPGVKGMKTTVRVNTLRAKIWQSMRIMRRFTQPDLARTTGASIGNVKKFVKRLEVHGYIAKIGQYVGGRAGEYQSYRLAKDLGPLYPTRCDTCNSSLYAPCNAKEKPNPEPS